MKSLHKLAEQAALWIYRSHGKVIHPDYLDDFKALLPNSTPRYAHPRIEHIVKPAKDAAELNQLYRNWRLQLPAQAQALFPEALPGAVKAFTTPGDDANLPASRQIFMIGVGHTDYDLHTLVHELEHWLTHSDYVAQVVNTPPTRLHATRQIDLYHEGIIDWLAQDVLRSEKQIDWDFLAPPAPQNTMVNAYVPARATLSYLLATTPLTADILRRAALGGEQQAITAMRTHLTEAEQNGKLEKAINQAISYFIDRMQERMAAIQPQAVAAPADDDAEQDDAVQAATDFPHQAAI